MHTWFPEYLCWIALIFGWRFCIASVDSTLHGKKNTLVYRYYHASNGYLWKRNIREADKHVIVIDKNKAIQPSKKLTKQTGKGNLWGMLSMFNNLNSCGSGTNVYLLLSQRECDRFNKNSQQYYGKSIWVRYVDSCKSILEYLKN